MARWELNEGKMHTTIRKPIFVIDEKLAIDFNLKRIRPEHSGNVSSFLFKPNKYTYLIELIKHKKKSLQFIEIKLIITF